MGRVGGRGELRPLEQMTMEKGLVRVLPLTAIANRRDEGLPVTMRRSRHRPSIAGRLRNLSGAVMTDDVHTPLREGDILAGKDRVERVLGQGGMGMVVAATNIKLDQRSSHAKGRC